ncbi:MAG: hypothetical protein FWG35_00705 [Spirochaetaceae bacterium]|nr:hypothetical protein [Spirochaetaceae bacterium]
MMSHETIRARSVLAAAVRSFFAAKDYLEVDTPLLAPALIPESAIEVFATRFEHPYREGREMYLTPSPELWMKRLLAAGCGNIFQICKAFRNAEALGRLHNPEFTILEYYTVDADCGDSLALTEELFAALIRAFEEKVPTGRRERLSPPFRRLTMAQAFADYAKLDLATLAPRESRDAPQAASLLTAKARELGLPCKDGDTWEEAFNRVFAGVVEPALPRDRPLVLLDYPREVRCLARDIPGTPWNERWELYVDGVETANCFTEETDTEKIAAFFREEAAKKEKALVRHAPDREFAALNGMPRCSGVALGLDRLIMAFCGENSLGGVILFPFSDSMPE